MKYLPILQELFESDLYIFFLIGMAAAIVVALWMKTGKKMGIGIWISLGIYGVCEIFVNIGINYMLEIVFLVIGVLALGAAAGCLAGLLFQTYRLSVRRKRTDRSG